MFFSSAEWFYPDRLPNKNFEQFFRNYPCKKWYFPEMIKLSPIKIYYVIQEAHVWNAHCEFAFGIHLQVSFLFARLQIENGHFACVAARGYIFSVGRKRNRPRVGRRRIYSLYLFARLDIPYADHGIKRTGRYNWARVVYVDWHHAKLMTLACVSQFKVFSLPWPYFDFVVYRAGYYDFCVFFFEFGPGAAPDAVFVGLLLPKFLRILI